jgi:hypothetical protein
LFVGIPNFAKNSKTTTLKRSAEVLSERQTPDILRQLLARPATETGVGVGAGEGEGGGDSPRKRVRALAAAERDKAARLEQALLRALLPAPAPAQPHTHKS